ncbi:MAG: hypothetical protein OXM61_04260 [Candidatus Poribacteria bacterium]|nr:hypothetical protein [Candidatus Poribacteria bacterium]
MKAKIFTTNVDVAAAAACGGLTLMPLFPLFMEQHGLRYSVVALVITLWGFISLKLMDTKPEPQRAEQIPPVFHKPQPWKNKRKLITAAVLFLIIGLMLFGAIKMIDAIQMNTTPCPGQIWKDCIKKEAQQPPCPQSEWKSSCPLDASEQSEQQIKLECIKDMPEPVCPPQYQRVPCPLDVAKQSEQPFNKEDSNE